MARFRLNYDLDTLRGDLFGGVTSMVVALPVSLGFGIASGMGAAAGLYGAIAVGFFASVFGGTRSQISGPTAPMTVAMAVVLTSHASSLTDALTVRQLHPWFANVKKRQVKAPKVYVRDSGLLHRLLGIGTQRELLTHPRVGASWEGFVVEQVLATEPHDEAYFWATHQGAEIDLVLRRGGALYGVECKFADAPRMTPSIRNALDDVGLDRVAVVNPGDRRFPLSDRVEVVPLSALDRGEALFA